jgi:glycosyltransferase involved in cell wall biosynthesis
MYEAFASHTPFLTTPVGNVSDHADVVKIVRTPEEMRDAGKSLLRDDAERRRLAGQAFQLWQARHTWEQIAAQYESLYTALVERGRTVGAAGR